MQNMSKVNKLFTFEEKKIVFNNAQFYDDISKIDYPVYTISFLGEARFGKSTLINCFLTYLLNENINICKTSSMNKHCTIGIDYCFVKKDDVGYLILDCQGINHGDSSNDCKLMMLAYELSDLIVFTDKKLNNGTLKSLEPMNMFERHININAKKQKPILMLRYRDYDLEADISDVLNDLLEQHDDQFNSLRKTIKNIYSDVIAIHTEQLNKNDRKNLNDADYDVILQCDENRFLELCSEIQNACFKCQTKKLNDEYINTIIQLIDQINTSEKINSKVFDVLTLNLHNDLNDFIGKIDTYVLYEKLDCFTTQSFFTEVSNLRKKINESIIEFNETFSKCDAEITANYLVKLTDRESYLSSLIDEIKQEAIKEGAVMLQNILNANINKINLYLGSDVTKVEYDNTIIDDIIREYDRQTKNIVVDIKLETMINYKNQLHQIIDVYEEHNKNMLASIEENQNKYKKKLNDILTFDNIQNINIMKSYENQPFILNLYKEWKMMFNQGNYDKFINLRLTVNNLNITTLKSYYTKNIKIDWYNNDNPYINIINEFISKKETKDDFIVKLKTNINNVRSLGCIFNEMVKLHPYVNFVEVNCGELSDIIYGGTTSIGTYFTNESFEVFVNKWIKIVDDRFTTQNVIKLFKIDIYKNKENLIYVKFGKSSLASKYVIKKIKQYYNENAFNRFATGCI